MKKVSLAELMGRAGAAKSERKLTLDDLGDLLGERLPKLEYTPVGRMRLANALRNRFGDNYRQLPGIDDVMKEFDDLAKFEITKQKIKQLGRK